MALSILHRARGNCTTFCCNGLHAKYIILLMFQMAKATSKVTFECVVKGYHQCPFDTSEGDTFIALKKIGERGRAFRVTNAEGNQLGHLQKEVVPILWTLEEGAEISW